VQGRLRKEELGFEIRTQCACCERKIEITIDGKLNYQLENDKLNPLVFEPDVDWKTFTGSNIIDAY
jgi:hypothetical protein